MSVPRVPQVPVVPEAEAAADRDGGGERRDQHALAQLLEVVPDRHLKVVGQLFFVGEEELLHGRALVVVISDGERRRERR